MLWVHVPGSQNRVVGGSEKTYLCEVLILSFTVIVYMQYTLESGSQELFRFGHVCVHPALLFQ